MGWLSRFFGGTPKSNSELPQRNVPKTFHLEGSGEFSFDIVGESHYQNALESIVGGKTDESVEFDCQAKLICDDANPYDKNAVAVYINGKKVGHLARPVAAGFRDIQRRNGWAGQPVTADARIVGGWDRGSRGQAKFGVKLDI